jgi:hypothetical protein
MVLNVSDFIYNYKVLYFRALIEHAFVWRRLPKLYLDKFESDVSNERFVQG